MILPSLKIIARDFRLLEGHTRALLHLKWLDMTKTTVASTFDKYAKKNPDKICFYFEDQTWTFKQVEETSNQIGNVFSKEGFRHNDVIALFMENRPEYVCTWLGLSKIGVVASLINYNLRSTPLKHCIDIAKSKAIIYGTELNSAVTDINSSKGPTYPLYAYGPGEKNQKHLKDLDALIKTVPTTRPETPKAVNFRSPIFYCYTSGTTGLPKASIITHSRFFMASISNHHASDLTENDKIYMTLPLYHVAGGMLGISQTLTWGSPMIIRKQFSASNFWKDCIKYNATAAQYIAETSRFLLRIPPSPEDTKHKVRVMFGNGFRKEIWEEFVKRFNVSKITEFYASTEGNANMVNYDNKLGATGIIPPWLEKVYPIALVKVDENTGELYRDPASGFLVRCQPGEAGELMGKVVVNSPFRDFKGYAADKSANEKKLVHNIFVKGDTYFRSGDLLYKDRQGFYYFKDRMGDTFRWKSENVSTAEVETVISSFTALNDNIVFGVTVPGYDGNAGMAVIADPDGSLNFVKLEKGITETLPPYARPLFIRVVKEIEMTGTHKFKKTDLAKEGYDLKKISPQDKMYFLNGNSKYVPFTKEISEKILQQSIKL